MLVAYSYNKYSRYDKWILSVGPSHAGIGVKTAKHIDEIFLESRCMKIRVCKFVFRFI